MESLSSTIQAFNKLRRAKTTPTGIPSHWVFGIRHVPLPPEGDLVYIIHPRSRYTVTSKKPGQIVSLSSPAEKAQVALPMLLSAFIHMGDVPPGQDPSQASPVMAPWTWSCEDPELGAALQSALREAGVKKELCTVGSATAEEKATLTEEWSGFVGMLMKQFGLDAASKKEVEKDMRRTTQASGNDPANACAQCHRQASEGEGLKTCARCRAVKYCSRECQRAGWTDHKAMCGKSDAAMDAVTYFCTVARTKELAQQLARALNFTLPVGRGDFKGLMPIARRLVVTGNDTSDNLCILFGPAWAGDSGVDKTVKEARLGVLLNPPRGSPDYAMYSPMDAGAPKWSPRPAVVDEQSRVDEVRQMQAKLRERMGSRQSPNNNDMMAILTEYGAGWDEMLPTYQLAINAMDQGVVPR